jgi:hypothetical protein
MPEQGREVATATDGELWARRAAYARETRWAPPYVVGELRDAHIAEDTYRADAVRAWHRADAAADEAERTRVRREAKEHGALAQEVGAYREALTEVAEARRRWHAATALDRQRALMSDTELRRRYPDAELPSLHSREEPDVTAPAQETSGPVSEHQESAVDHTADRTVGAEVRHAPELNAEPVHAESGADEPVPDVGDDANQRSTVRRDVQAALKAARRAQEIIAEREQQAGSEAGIASDDVMRRREADAEQDALARRSAVRQDPAPSHRLESLQRNEPELEAGQ